MLENDSTVTEFAKLVTGFHSSSDFWVEKTIYQNDYCQNKLKVAALILLFIFPFSLCCFGLIGNLLVIIAISIERRLQNTTNYFLFSLALADLLVCLLVMPISLLTELSIDFKWSFTFCLLYLYLDVFLCSASIVHMSWISFDRYLGISQPLKRRNRRKRMLAVKIAFVWLLTIIISSPLAILSSIDRQNVLNEEGKCGIRSRAFMLYGSTFSFLIPVIVLTVTTSKTTNLLKQQVRLLSNKQDANYLRRTIMPARKKFCRLDSHNLSTGSSRSVLVNLVERANRSTGGGRLSLSSSNLPPPIKRERKFQRQMTAPTTEWNLRNKMIEDDFSKNHMDSNKPTVNVLTTVATSTDKKGVEDPETVKIDAKTDAKAKMDSDGPSRISATFTWLFRNRRKTSSFAPQGTIPSMKYASNGSGSRKSAKLSGSKTAQLASEQKATRVLIIQIICFFFCWTPFFVQNIIVGLCGEKCEVFFPSWFFLCAVWFGYFSSVLNPIIYSCFNRRFREAFIRICKCDHSFRYESSTIKCYLTEAQGLNSTLNSLCQKFSRRIDSGASASSQMAFPTRIRRSSYAGEMGAWSSDLSPTSKRKSVRRSTLVIPNECSSSAFFVKRRHPPITFLDQYKRDNSLLIQPHLYTISDSEEEIDRSSKESLERETSVVMGRPSSRIFEGLGNIIRKMSWHGVGSANSIFRPATNEIGKERFRKITPHILFPLDFQEIITFGGSENRFYEQQADSSSVTICSNGGFNAMEARRKKALSDSCNDDYDEYSVKSSSMSTVEEFFAQRIGEIESMQTSV